MNQLLTILKNNTIYRNKYKTHHQAVVISCFFNPQNSPYRLKAFNIWYDTIKHLNHRIIECVIGDGQPQLPENENIKRVYTNDLLWHKETLLNNIIRELPKKYKYVFWVDADLIFTNPNWLYYGSIFLKKCNILQPFEWCIHMEKDELIPSPEVLKTKSQVFRLRKNKGDIRVWRSFCANYETTNFSNHKDYDIHGHVGFAYGAKRELLDKVPFYEKCHIGGCDHIMAHAAAGQIPSSCIEKTFMANIDEINEWSREFYGVMKGKIGYVSGDVYHIWHGDLKNRQYHKRIIEFTEKSKEINEKDKNGLYKSNPDCNTYINNYFKHREVTN